MAEAVTGGPMVARAAAAAGGGRERGGRAQRRAGGLGRRLRRWGQPWGGVGVVILGLGCGGLTDLGGTPGLPSGVADPATFRTSAGALGMYRMVVADFQAVAAGYVAVAGLLTDELQYHEYGASPLVEGGGAEYAFDVRRMPEGGEDEPDVYRQLNLVRRDAVQALGALAKYDSGAHPALMGEAYALEGYAEVLLADLYCSGVPLSTIVFEGDYVYRPGSTTQQVYQHAVALFDSALALAGDSARVLNLARVGKGRALLNLGDYAGAAASVAAVPDTFRYRFPVFWNATVGVVDIQIYLSQRTSVSDREGGTGLPYRSSGDPRTQVVGNGTNGNEQPVYFPAKYGTPGSTTPLVIASGVEARLIEAEAALHDHPTDGQWLTLLNGLRRTAISPALPDLSDPGSADAQLDTLFAERAAWLFVTGTRQGDLRRLIRLYHRLPDQVYPSGVFLGAGGVYGTDVTVPIPGLERQTNPLFAGCYNRGA